VGAPSGSIHDGDSDIDTDESVAITASNGFYTFSGSGRGHVRRPPGRPRRLERHDPGRQARPDHRDGEQRGGANFGSWQNVIISGYVYHDANHNKIRDPLESPLGGWQVFIDADSDGLLDPDEVSVRTNNAGKYTFTTLPAGTYTIAIVQQPGWYRTTQPHLPSRAGPGRSRGESVVRREAHRRLTVARASCPWLRVRTHIGRSPIQLAATSGALSSIKKRIAPRLCSRLGAASVRVRTATGKMPVPRKEHARSKPRRPSRLCRARR
jgi:hypothetical protein